MRTVGPSQRAAASNTGVAEWFPPRTWSGMAVGALPGYLRAFGRRFGVCSRFMSVAVRTHPREQSHWYLAVIGVDPSRKGRGVGAALPRSRPARCDKEGIAADLESSNPENVPLYEHLGFQAAGARDLPKARPPSPRCGGRHRALNRRALLRLGDSRARQHRSLCLSATGNRPAS